MNSLAHHAPQFGLSRVPYQPSRSLDAKLRRRLVQKQVRRRAPLDLDRPVVSFTFDDVPNSVLDHALPMLEDKGWASTLYIATGLLGADTHMGRMMARDEVHSAHGAGHEIAAHSHLHRDYAQMETAALIADNRRSRSVFAEMDLPAPTAFAWPYGEATRAGKDVLSEQYTSLRGIRGQAHRKRVDLNQLGSQALFGDTLIEVGRKLDQLARKPGWLTLFTHDVREEPSPWGCTPAQFSAIVERVEAIGAEVLPVSTVVERIQHGQ